MKRRILISAAMALFLNACASAPPSEPAAPAPPPPPAAFDPTGTYDFTVSAQGMEIGGVMTIQGSADAGYTGTVNTEMGGGSMTNVDVDGQTMTFSLSEVGMDAELEFEGDEFSGFLTGGMGDADIYGVKRSGG
jgi:hypothetical protein